MNDISKVNAKEKLVLKINGATYNDRFDLEVVCEEENLLSITLYKLSEQSLIGRIVEVVVNNFCIFKGTIHRCDFKYGTESQIFITLEAKNISFKNISNVNFRTSARKVKNIIKAVIDKSTNNFEYIKMITQFNAKICAGDIISYDNNLYAIETVVYSWNHKEGFFQEIHAINNELHNVRYIK